MRKLLLLLAMLPSFLLAQDQWDNGGQWNSQRGTINANGLGRCYDIRRIDPMYWGKETLLSNSGKSAIVLEKGGSQSLSFYNNRQFLIPKGVRAFSDTRSDATVQFRYAKTEYEFENQVSQEYRFGVEGVKKVASAQFSAAFKNTVQSSNSNESMFVYTKMYKQFYKLDLDQAFTYTLDPDFMDYVERLGRDITPEGFIYRFGTHYASTTYYGGNYMEVTSINRSDYMSSVSNEAEYKADVEATIKGIKASAGTTQGHKSTVKQRSVVSFGETRTHTVGGDLQRTGNPDQWANTVKDFLEVVDANLTPLYKLLTPAYFPNTANLDQKRELLRQAIERAEREAEAYLSTTPSTSDFFRKEPVTFQLTVNYIKCNGQGAGESGSSSEYYGEMAMGFLDSRGNSIGVLPAVFWGASESAPLSLSTGSTFSSFSTPTITYTVPVEQLDGFVSVWGKVTEQEGDSQGAGAVFGAMQADTPLGTKTPQNTDNRISYANAMVQPAMGTAMFTSSAGDALEVSFTLTRVSANAPMAKATKQVGGGAQLTSLAASGNVSGLREMVKQGADPNQPGLLSSAIRNKQSGNTLASIMDMGVKPSSADLDVALETNNKEAALMILERDVTPNAAQFDRVASYKDPNLFYAFIRQGAKPTQAHVKAAIEMDNPALVKDLLKFGGTGLNVTDAELEYAVRKNDYPMAQDMVAKGAKSTPQILATAMQSGNKPMIDLLVPVTPATHESLAVAANMNNFDLFKIFVDKGARLSNNEPLEKAIAQRNMPMLELGLKAGGNADQAMNFAIQKNEKQAIELCLVNRANPAPALTYMLQGNDLQFFTHILQDFNGDANQALREAVQANKLEFGRAALQTNRADASAMIEAVAATGNTPWVQLLLDFRADPNRGLGPAVDNQHTAVVDLLLTRGARATDDRHIASAAKLGNLDMVRLLVEKGGANPESGREAAIETGKVPLVRYLLEKGARPTGMAVPAGKGQLDMVKLLVDFKADVNEGAKPAVEGNHTEVAVFLLDKGASVQGLIAIAAGKGNKAVVEKLLSKKADPTEGAKPAVSNNHTEVALLLLDKGAKIDGLMEIAGGKGNKVLVQKLLDKKANPTEGIRPAALADHAEVALLLLDAGADVKGIMPISASKGSELVVKKLLEKGADPNDGIKLAVQNKHVGTAKILIEGGADVKPASLMVIAAVENQQLEMIRLLEANGTDLGYVDASGNGFLHISVNVKNLPMLQTFAGFNKLDINQKNHQGNTPLHLAARDGKVEVNEQMVKFLLTKKPDVNAVNNDGKTPRKYAKGSGVKRAIKDAGGLKKVKGVKEVNTGDDEEEDDD